MTVSGLSENPYNLRSTLGVVMGTIWIPDQLEEQLEAEKDGDEGFGPVIRRKIEEDDAPNEGIRSDEVDYAEIESRTRQVVREELEQVRR